LIELHDRAPKQILRKPLRELSSVNLLRPLIPEADNHEGQRITKNGNGVKSESQGPVSRRLRRTVRPESRWASILSPNVLAEPRGPCSHGKRKAASWPRWLWRLVGVLFLPRRARSSRRDWRIQSTYLFIPSLSFVTLKLNRFPV